MPPQTWFGAVSITPSDTVNLTVPSLALLAASDGTITVDMERVGTNIALFVKAGIPLGVRVLRIYATGTTATGIVALI